MWREFKKNKLALAALVILGAFYGLAIFADFFAPYAYDDDNMLYSWAPPSKIHFINFEEKVFRPYVYQQSFTIDEYYKRQYTEGRDKIYPIRFFVKGFPYKFLGVVPADIHLFGVERGRIHLSGADIRGRDMFSRLLYGARVSLSIGLIGVAISFCIGMIVGGISGYFGGWTDTVMMRLVEMMMMLPGFYFLLALRSSFPPEMDSRQVYMLIVVILSLIGWASLARVIRGMVLSLKENDYVLAAKAIGLSDFKIITRHILPHTFSYVLVAICLSIPGYIIGEAALSLLGLGIQEPYASWGNMLAMAQGIITIQFYPWVLAPGLLIIIVTMSFNIIGDKLRDMFDPKRKIFS
ncbi:MAG: ABC transporter permease [Candidatus Omnitrophota bacterium]